jgi:prepilin-type N-terminal cleavage/methylation domain-containing protein
LSRSGFTLIEAIVVSLIIAVLAAVSIPMYNGYVKQSQKQSAAALAKTASAAANAFYRKKGKHATLDQLNLSYDSTSYSVNIDSSNSRIIVKIIGLDIGDTVEYK